MDWAAALRITLRVPAGDGGAGTVGSITGAVRVRRYRNEQVPFNVTP